MLWLHFAPSQRLNDYYADDDDETTLLCLCAAFNKPWPDQHKTLFGSNKNKHQSYDGEAKKKTTIKMFTRLINGIMEKFSPFHKLIAQTITALIIIC